MLEKLFVGTVGVSVAATAVILVLALCSSPIQKRYAAKWRYWIWLLLAVRMLVPWNPDLSFGRLRIEVPKVILQQGNVSESVSFAGVKPGQDKGQGETKSEGSANVQVGAETVSEETKLAQRISLLELLTILWSCGVSVVFGVNLEGYLRFRRRITRNAHPAENPVLFSLVEDILAHGRRRGLGILRSDEAASPMVIGFLRPYLVLPDVEYGEELAFIIKHELTHYRRYDTCYKLLLVAVCSVHWFNPFAWLMLRQAGADLELSCDEAVVAREPYVNRRAYTEAIVSAMGRQCGKKTALTMQWNDGMKLMKRRLKNILQPSKNKNGIAIVLMSFALLLALGTVLTCGAREVYAAASGGLSELAVLQSDTSKDKSEQGYLKRHFYPELEEISYDKGEDLESLSAEDLIEIEAAARDFLGAWMSRDIVGMRRQILFYDVFPAEDTLEELYEVMSKVEDCGAVPVEILSVPAFSGNRQAEVFRRLPEDERFGYVDLKLERYEGSWTVCGLFYTIAEERTEEEKGAKHEVKDCLHRDGYDETVYCYGRGMDYHIVAVPGEFNGDNKPLKVRCNRLYVETVHTLSCCDCHVVIGEYEKEYVEHESRFCLHNPRDYLHVVGIVQDESGI